MGLSRAPGLRVAAGTGLPTSNRRAKSNSSEAFLRADRIQHRHLQLPEPRRHRRHRGTDAPQQLRSLGRGASRGSNRSGPFVAYVGRPAGRRPGPAGGPAFGVKLARAGVLALGPPAGPRTAPGAPTPGRGESRPSAEFRTQGAPKRSGTACQFAFRAPRTVR